MKLLSVSLLAIASVLMACENKEDVYVMDPGNIAGIIRNEVTMQAGVDYYLDGELIVEFGGILTIPAGTEITVKGGTSSYVAVAQGGKILAQGAENAPIVFTSDVKEAGSWGGLVICGNAPTNLMGNTSTPLQAEVSDILYGGTDENDNSGIYTYVRTEYTGYNYDDDKQFNGFSFFGVGSETIIHHISSYESMDDGIEFFGGNVNAEFIVSINSHDDGIDFTDGWQGTGKYWYAYNSSKSGIEGSNNENNGDATPSTSVVLSNITVYKMGERPWYLKKGAGSQTIDNLVIGGLVDNVGDAYFYFEDQDLSTISRVSQQKLQFTNVRFYNRGLNNATNASGNLLIDENESAIGAGQWTDDQTLAPIWVGAWAMPNL